MLKINQCFVFSHMDMLTKSFSGVDNIYDLGLEAYEPFSVHREVHPQKHYQVAYQLKCGATLNMTNTQQGCKIEFGGQDLQRIRERYKLTDETILRLLAASPKHKRTTRLDYCFNIAGAGSPHMVQRLIDRGRYKGRLKPAPSHFTPGTTRGKTVMFGAESSAYRIRVYDKAAEMGDLWMAWTRCESQARDEYAQNAVTDLFENKISLADHFRTKQKESIGEFPFVWWRAMMKGDTPKITHLRRKEGKFEGRMSQLLYEIKKKANESPEQMEYISNVWLNDLIYELRHIAAR